MTHQVGTKLPNAWGLYDVLGNAGEMTSTTNRNKRFICRGGSYKDDDNSGFDQIGGFWSYPHAAYLHLAFSKKISYGEADKHIGLRLVKSITSSKE